MKFSELEIDKKFFINDGNDGWQCRIWVKSTEHMARLQIEEGIEYSDNLKISSDAEVAPMKKTEIRFNEPLSLLDQVRLCAQAMNIMLIDTNSNEMKYAFNYIEGVPGINSKCCFYWPITNDEQAMALAKRFMLEVNFFVGSVRLFHLNKPGDEEYLCYSDESINHAIVECVATIYLFKPKGTEERIFERNMHFDLIDIAKEEEKEREEEEVKKRNEFSIEQAIEEATMEVEQQRRIQLEHSNEVERNLSRNYGRGR